MVVQWNFKSDLRERDKIEKCWHECLFDYLRCFWLEFLVVFIKCRGNLNFSKLKWNHKNISTSFPVILLSRYSPTHQSLSPSFLVTERLVFHLAPIVSPLPFLLLPVVHATYPFVIVDLGPVLQILSQPSVGKLHRFRQFAVSVFAFKVRIQPTFFPRR